MSTHMKRGKGCVSPVLLTDSQLPTPGHQYTSSQIVLNTMQSHSSIHVPHGTPPYVCTSSNLCLSTAQSTRVLTHRQGSGSAANAAATRTPMKKRTIYDITIQQYWLLSGFSTSILECTGMILWSPGPWVDFIWHFLQHINRKIILSKPWLPHHQQQQNIAIMEDIWALHLPTAQAIQINSVRTFLKINFLSEITDHSGVTLLPQTHSPHQNPMHCSSTVNLTTAPYPGLCNHALDQKPGSSGKRSYCGCMLSPTPPNCPNH